MTFSSITSHVSVAVGIRPGWPSWDWSPRKVSVVSRSSSSPQFSSPKAYSRRRTVSLSVSAEDYSRNRQCPGRSRDRSDANPSLPCPFPMSARRGARHARRGGSSVGAGGAPAPLRAWTSRKNRRGMRGRRREERRRGGAGGGRRMSAPPVHESWIRH